MWHWVRFRVFQSALVDRLEHLIAVRVDWGPEPFPIKSCMPVEMERWTPSDKVREHPLQPYWPAAAAVVAVVVVAVVVAVVAVVAVAAAAVAASKKPNSITLLTLL